MMDGTALVFCEGAFGKADGKTANGLVRFGRRYDVLGGIDSDHAGHDAREIIPGVTKRMPIFSTLAQAVEALDRRPDFLVIGLNPEDGRLPPRFRRVIADALRRGISVDSALRPYLHEDAEFPGLAQQSSSRLRSVGYPKPISQLRTYTGEIGRIAAAKVAVLGTHSVVGKRTTSVRLTETLLANGLRTEMIGTGETSWLQGVRSTVLLDSVVRKYVPGELEGAMLEANERYSPQVFVLEGQGSFLDPANPTGIEFLTTARPSAIVMQHAPMYYAGDEDRYGIAALSHHIRVAELISAAPVVAITLSHEGTEPAFFAEAVAAIRGSFDLLVTDVLAEGAEALAEALCSRLELEYAAGTT
jgi:uncharacterized NAD-dependent epimerase/dehydratase family protein